jgi:hypothetical protein
VNPSAGASGRTRTILERFPRHFDAARPGTLFAEVVQALSAALDVQTAQVGRVRRAHRLAHADEPRDLLLLAATHGLRDDDFAVLPMRFGALRALQLALAEPGVSDADWSAAVASLSGLIGITPDFPSWPEDDGDANLARLRLTAAVAEACGLDSQLELLRWRISVCIGLHRAGNGTIGALLGAAANSLDLELEHVRHHSAGYWHVAYVRDRLRLVRPEPAGSAAASTPLVPELELVALEENPLVEKTLEPFPVEHAHRFGLNRPALEPSRLDVHVIGVGDGTLDPMLVDRDRGRGVVFHGAVPDGQRLIWKRDGSASLDGADRTRDAWAFEGAVFADGGPHELSPLHPRDFCFSDDAGATARGQAAKFAVALPWADAWSPAAVWPRPSGAFPPLTLAVGASRWAFFVRVAHFGTTDLAGTTASPAIAFFQAGVFDGSVWAGPPSVTAAELGFAWAEREAFAVKIWLPERFAALDDASDPAAGPSVRERVRAALQRHRAAGVHVYVEHTSDPFALGEGMLSELEAEDPLLPPATS